MAESTTNKRIGFHYFNDTLHYRDKDLNAWLPQLISLGAKWLVLKSESQRAIPEAFVRALVQAGIQPIIHMPLSPSAPPPPLELSPIFKAYASWGARHIVLFDEPNMHEQWGDSSWSTQHNLVDRFLEIYLPLADQALQDGLRPGFPPLRRGGDYWDTAFLRAALQGIKQRERNALLDQLFLSVNATTNGHPVHWGAGGPERWPGSRPYFTQTGEEDQKGFYVFDWYTAITEAVLNKKLPIALLKSGSTSEDPEQHAAENLEIAQLLINQEHNNNPVPDHVFSGNFWVLAAGPDEASAKNAWYRQDGTLCDAVKALKALHLTDQPAKIAKTMVQPEPDSAPTETLAAGLGDVPSPTPPDLKADADSKTVLDAVETPSACSIVDQSKKSLGKSMSKQGNGATRSDHLIEHYLLLPTYEWGVADWHLEVIQPYIKKHQPTIGFSIDEALCAQLVTVIGSAQNFSPDVIARLEKNGCQVTQIQGTGTSIAMQLATL